MRSKVKQRVSNNLASREPYHAVEWRQPIAIAVVAMVLIFVRMQDRVYFGFLWAEDGRVFLSEAYKSGAASIFESYAQYLHLIPRLLVFGYSKVGRIDHAARPLMWASALMLCGICAYLFTFARKTLPLPAAAAFGLAPILVPHLGEVWLTVTNLQWVIAPALLVLLWDEFCSHSAQVSRVSGDMTRGTAIVAMTLTGPFGLIFAPLVVVGLIVTRRVRRSHRALLAIGAYFAAATTQLVVILLTPRQEIFPGIPPRAPLGSYICFPWAAALLRRLSLDFVMPSVWTAPIGNYWPIAALVVTGALLICLLLSDRVHRIAVIGLAVIAVGIWMLGVIRVGRPHLDLKWDQLGGRYFYIPFVLMAWALIISLQTTPYKSVRFTAGVLLSLSLTNSFFEFRAQTWEHANVVFQKKTQSWQITVPPSPQWAFTVRPEWIGK